jgi:hypothetical protein
MAALERESRAPGGSSARGRRGRLPRARAMATRCCWPLRRAVVGPVGDANGAALHGRGERGRARVARAHGAGRHPGSADVQKPTSNASRWLQMLHHGEALLSAELQELLADDLDLSLVGFSDGELDKLFAHLPEEDGSGEGAPRRPDHSHNSFRASRAAGIESLPYSLGIEEAVRPRILL